MAKPVWNAGFAGTVKGHVEGQPAWLANRWRIALYAHGLLLFASGISLFFQIGLTLPFQVLAR
jgi:hypothetical protein